MSKRRWPTVPVGPDADRWVTREKHRLVLGVVHNVTSATRLLDVLSIRSPIRGSRWSSPGPDHRLFLMESVRRSPIWAVIVLPWKQAVSTRFDLAVAAIIIGELSAFPNSSGS